MSENMYNLNIERAVLSAIIFDPQIFEEIAAKLKAHDFYLPFHQHIFTAMEDLTRENKPIDEEFLKTKLRSGGNFDEVALLDVLSANPITNTDAYLGEIKSRATKRALATLATTIKKVTLEDDLPTEEIMNLVEKKLYEITQNSTSEDFRGSKEITLTMLGEIERLKALGNSKLLGIDTGFRNLNDKTQGFGKGDLVIIAARPAMGKTSLVLNMTQKAIERNEGVAFFSLEMPAEQLMLRLLSTETSIPLQNLRVGNLTDDEWSRLIVATDKMARRKLFVDDGGYATIHHVRSKLRKLKSQHPEITMAIIDYLQLMSGDGGREGRQQEISEISRGLKQLARELQIPILALSQLNRGVESRENKRPMLSDLRESGCLSGDSMIVDAKSGKRYRIDELANNKDLLPIETKSMDKNLQVNNFTITNAFFSGEKTVYKLTTQSGKTINATANHKFYRVDGWIRLDDLSVGDKIATPDGVIIYWDEIVSIEKLEKVKTYDLTVDSVHNFVANDIIVHNSIEQDADIVMFVYRDDVYREAAEKEKEMKAKANGQEYDNKYQKKMEEETELIVGKQRNGPTGTVRLIFQKRFTRFVDDHKGADTPFEVIYEEGGNMDTRDMGHIDFTPPF
jgi:replicative DNA helicase